MITIISGTNRPLSNTRQVADVVAGIYREHNVQTQILDLENLPDEVAFSEVFGKRSQEFGETVQKYVVNVDKFIFIAPEYNGSFPGILKVFLDAIEPRHWYGKKAALIGIGSGRAGNLRGLDHLMGVLNYLQINVLHFKPTLAHLKYEPGRLELSPLYFELLKQQVDLFTDF